MKGVVFNIFEDFIVENFSDEDWEAVLEDTGNQDEVFVGPRTYEDSVLLEMVSSAVNLKKLDANSAIRGFGKFAFKRLKNKVDVSIDFESAQDFLKGLDGIIHVEVRKLLMDANPPKFEYSEEGDYIILKYYSKRNLCVLVEGLLDGLAEFYGRSVEYSQDSCTHCGDKFCTFKIKFS